MLITYSARIVVIRFEHDFQMIDDQFFSKCIRFGYSQLTGYTAMNELTNIKLYVQSLPAATIQQLTSSHSQMIPLLLQQMTNNALLPQ